MITTSPNHIIYTTKLSPTSDKRTHPLSSKDFLYRYVMTYLLLGFFIQAQAQFPASMELSNLCGPNGFVLNGIDQGDTSGSSVSGIGDVNGDGIDDLIIGAINASPNGNSNAGESYIVFGSAAGFGASLNLSTLNGMNGFVLNGIDALDISGVSVSGAGDLNGDGIDDIIIAAIGFGPTANRSGESYVVFGSASGFGASLDLNTLNGSNGFVLNGIDMDDFSGLSVSTAGDVNGDGIEDIIIGASGGDPNSIVDAGESYVVFGSTTGFGSSFNLNTLNGINGFVLNGIDMSDGSGIVVSAAGDVNGDGIDDILIGAREAAPNGNIGAGESYVVFGSINPFSPSLDLSTLNGSNGFILNRIDANDASGTVSGAGDVNGDGIDDIIIGVPVADPNGNFSGESYVVFGSSNPFSQFLDLSALNGSNGFVLNGIDADDISGRSVSGAGDVNGDGIDDIIIGASSADPNGNNSGESYVVFGSTGGFGPAFNLSTLDGTNGFVLNGNDANDNSGGSVSGAGDVNGDGIDDLIIGASNGDPNGNFNAGESYVVFGSCGPNLMVNGGVEFIPNCSDTPQIDDLTLFEGCDRNFILDNSTGTEDLVINNLSSSNPLFRIGLGGFPITIPAGSSITFSIRFISISTTTEVSDITIENNDCNDLTYSFRIQNETGLLCEVCNEEVPMVPVFVPNRTTQRVGN